MLKLIRKTFIVLILFLFMSCAKYLDTVSDRSLAILSKLDEYQQLLDNEILYSNAPGITELGTDDVFIPSEIWFSAVTVRKNAYVWAADIYEGNTDAVAILDWSAPYEAIYYANVTLEGLENLNINDAELQKYREVKGQALFLRAFHHFLLQEIYGQPYRPKSSHIDMGIPLKLSSNFSSNTSRATVRATFDQIISDLETAAQILDADYQVVFKYRASKSAVHALLSRVYLSSQNYEMAWMHADKCLELYGVLLDFNDLGPSYRLPFPDNPEVLFAKRQNSHITGVNPIIDTVLFDGYSEHDLRKSVFYQLHAETNTPRLKTLYSGNIIPFAGLATDEVYLNRAESRARLGDVYGAMEDLNKLLIKRYSTGNFTPLRVANQRETLDVVLLERRKELVFRGLRWGDLRRLNQDADRAETLRRIIGDTEYRLSPHSPNYAFPIPINEVLMNNLFQNERHETPNY